MHLKRPWKIDVDSLFLGALLRKIVLNSTKLGFSSASNNIKTFLVLNVFFNASIKNHVWNVLNWTLMDLILDLKGVNKLFNNNNYTYFIFIISSIFVHLCD